MKIGILFPGYGSQFVGMGKDLYDNLRIVQEYYEESSVCLDRNFVKLCFASSDSELKLINNAYTALYLTSFSTAMAIKSLGIKFDLVAGHDVGEYCAISVSNGLNFADSLYFLNKLATFYLSNRENMDDIKSIKVNGLSAKRIDQICENISQSDEEQVAVAIYEAKTEHLVTGNESAIESVIDQAQDAGADRISKKTPAHHEGFHTPLATDLAEQIKIYLTKIDFKDLDTTLINNVDAKEIQKAQDVQDCIMRQIVEPIQWHNVLKKFDKMDIIIIPSPSKQLFEEVSNLYPNKQILAIENMQDFSNLQNLLAPDQTIIKTGEII